MVSEKIVLQVLAEQRDEIGTISPANWSPERKSLISSGTAISHRLTRL